MGIFNYSQVSLWSLTFLNILILVKETYNTLLYIRKGN